MVLAVVAAEADTAAAAVFEDELLLDTAGPDVVVAARVCAPWLEELRQTAEYLSVASTSEVIAVRDM